MRRALAVVAVLGVLMVARPPSAWACSCVASSPAELFKAAEVVFTGEVVLVARPGPRFPRITATFAVDSVYKGRVAASADVSTPEDEAGCGVSFVPGGSYAVFATDGGGVLQTTICSGTTSDLGVIARAGGPRVIQTYDPSALPATEQVPAPREPGRGGVIAAAVVVVGAVTAGTLMVLRLRSRGA